MLFVVPNYDLWFTCPQLGLLYIASSARKAGANVELLDFPSSKDPYSKLDLMLSSHDDVAITANVSQAYSATLIAKYVREKHPQKRIIWGGPYPSASAEYAKLIPELADIVVIGEGEKQIAQLVAGQELSQIKGIAYRSGNAFEVNPRADYIDDLDGLEFPAWDLVKIRDYDFPGQSPGYLIQTQRGCPFACINCTTFIHGTRYRTRSVESVLAEIEWLKNSFGAKEIHFWDDNFTLDRDRVKTLCEKIISKNLGLKMTLPNGIRADIDDMEMFKLMRRAGFYYVNLAIESAEQDVIDTLGKKLDLRRVRGTLSNLESAGFRIGLLFMMGMPFDTPDSIRKTVELAESIPGHHAHFFIVTPFPGTKLYEMVLEKGGKVWDYRDGFISFDDDDERFVNPSLSHAELRRLHRSAYRRFYTPSRIAGTIMKMLKEGSFLTDSRFLIKCGINLLTRNQR